jgi:osmotically-inducible protein OsmY
MKTDREIQDHVQQAVRWGSRIDAANIGVAVEHGIVTLSGTVDSFAERQAAQEAALRVSGIHDVANEIVVKVPGHLGRTDADIAQAVRAALESHVRMPSDRIKTTVSQGVVTLYGTVDTWWNIADAESAVANLAGVQDVVNELVVSMPAIDPGTIQRDIEEALERGAGRVARRIQISVHDGTVRLRGTVHSSAEREAVLRAARYTHGVRAVEDHLQVEHPEEGRQASEHLHTQLPL